jgi:hypothetical protein
MKISVHIEKLVLDGVPLRGAERPLLQAAVERELTRLLAGGVSREFRGGASVAHVQGGAMRISGRETPVQMGSGIASAVHQGIGGSRARRTPGEFLR